MKLIIALMFWPLTAKCQPAIDSFLKDGKWWVCNEPKGLPIRTFYPTLHTKPYTPDSSIKKPTPNPIRFSHLHFQQRTPIEIHATTPSSFTLKSPMKIKVTVKTKATKKVLTRLILKKGLNWFYIGNWPIGNYTLSYYEFDGSLYQTGWINIFKTPIKN